MKILCLLPNYIGDILMTTPALRILKKNICNSYIAVTIKPHLLELLDNNLNVDKFIIKNSRYLLIKEILKFKPDYVILFRTTFFNSLTTFLSNTKFSVGIDEEFSRFFLNLVIKKDRNRSYRYESLMLSERFLNYLGIKTQIDMLVESKKIDLYGYDNINIKTSLEKKILELGIKNNYFIVVSPCATRKTKMLLVQQYNYLLKSLLDKLDQKYFLILTGTNNDSNFITNITAGIKSERLKSLVGKVSLKELAYLLSISNLVITPDSGPAYISEAVGAKTVVFFTSTTPDKYGPFSDNVRLFYNPVFCSPCYKDKCKNYTCLKNFEIDELIKISLDFLKE